MKPTAKRSTGKEFDPGPRARIVPKEQRHLVSPNAMDPRRTKVRVSIYFDLDVLDFFKDLAAKPGAPPYQTQINAALRELMEKAKGEEDAVAHLRQAKGLIDAALRTIT